MNIRNVLALSLLLVPSIACAEEGNADSQRLSANDLVEHAAFWVGQLPELSQEEMSLLCNYLYLESASLHNQCTMQRTLISIHTASILMNKQLMVNEAEAKNVAKKTIKELNEFHNELLPSRTFLMRACQHCMSAIEQSEHTTLKKIIVSYQQYGRAVLAQFIKQDKPNIEKILSQTKKNMDSHLRLMGECAGTLNALLNNENPYVKDGIDRDVADMDVAMAVADTALGVMNDTTLSCANTKSMNADLLSICALFNKIFYNSLYQALKDNKSVFPIYLMFDENGLIEEDSRNEELPLLGEKITLNKKHLHL